MKWLMIDMREMVWIRGEEDYVKLSSFGVKMKPKLQTVFSGTVTSYQCLTSHSLALADIFGFLPYMAEPVQFVKGFIFSF